MSYCRWSSDDFQCDVYVYADCRGGWTTHVAGRRRVIDPTALPPRVSWTDDPTAYWQRYNAVNALVDAAPLVDIELPHDGETFNDDTPGACADRLEALRALGYVVPQYAIDELRAEQAEMTSAPADGREAGR